MSAYEINTTEKDDEVSLVDGFIRLLMSRQVKVSATPRKDEAERSILLLKKLLSSRFFMVYRAR
jgi:hypothetical protein